MAKVNVHTKRGTRPQITRLGFPAVSRLRLGKKKKKKKGREESASSNIILRLGPSKMPEVSVDELLVKQSTKVQRGNGGRDLARRKRLYTDVHRVSSTRGGGRERRRRKTWARERERRNIEGI